MYIDATLLFSYKQAITATTTSEKILDVQSVGSGLPVYPLVQIETPFENLTSLGVLIQASHAATRADITEASWNTIAENAPLTQDEINSTRTLNFGSLPPDSGNFLRLKYEVTGTPTKGNITATLVLDRQI